jgi:iron complex transport system ATP-binding protein
MVGFAFTAREVVRMGRHPHRAGRRSVSDDGVEAAMAAAAVAELADRRVTTLSGGEQTRVSLARVLAQDTPLLLLDEPTASLDIRHQELVMKVARGLAARGCTVVAVVHDLNLAAAHSDRIAVLDRGVLRTFASPWEALRPRLLRSVFDHSLDVCPHPTRPCPLVVSSA